MNMQTTLQTKSIVIKQQKQTLANICSNHKEKNKWIMMIDPEDTALKSLSNGNEIDAKKILKVNSTKVRIDVKNIQSALKKGNCSAVVLCKQLFAQSQIDWLSQQALLSETDFIVLDTPVTVH